MNAIGWTVIALALGFVCLACYAWAELEAIDQRQKNGRRTGDRGFVLTNPRKRKEVPRK